MQQEIGDPNAGVQLDMPWQMPLQQPQQLPQQPLSSEQSLQQRQNEEMFATIAMQQRRIEDQIRHFKEENELAAAGHRVDQPDKIYPPNTALKENPNFLSGAGDASQDVPRQPLMHQVDELFNHCAVVGMSPVSSIADPERYASSIDSNDFVMRFNFRIPHAALGMKDRYADACMSEVITFLCSYFTV